MDFFNSTNWGYMLEALNYMLNYEDKDYENYLIKYKFFTEAMDEYENFENFINDCISVKVMKKECPKYILSSLVDVVLKGKKSFERIDRFCNIFVNIIDTYGVTFPTEKLFKRNSDVDDFDISLTEETFNYELRAQIIDFMLDYPSVSEFIELVPKGLDGEYTWKDIPSKSAKQIEDEYIDDLTVEDDDKVSDLNRYSVLKYYSFYLKSI